jgi:hypothetical protein
MKRITAITLFAIVSFLTAGAALAQDHTIRATVPFDFTVGNKLLPSGTYTISSESPNIILIQNREKNVMAMSSTFQGDKQVQSGAKLVFNQYGNQYFLSEVICRYPAMNVEVPVSKLEKRVQHEEAALRGSTQTFVAAR